jgi:cytoskeletal protein RodZ
LRQKREERQIALAAISGETKIKQSLLEGLERGDVSTWPTGIFRRAYVRAYARAIGLDPEAVLREFLELYPEPIESDAQIAAALQQTGVGAETWRARLWQLGRWNAPERTATLPNPLPKPAVASAVAASAPSTSPSLRESSPNASPPAAMPSSPSAPRSPEAVVPAPEPTVATPPVDSPSSIDETADAPSRTETPAFEPDLEIVARLCTQLAQAADADAVVQLVDQAAALVHAAGWILWIWNPDGSELVPALAGGYPARVIARLRAIGEDDDNATASAFRSNRLTVVAGAARRSGALVAPLLRAGGAVGALAVEVQDGMEQFASARAVVGILAAQLATLFEAPIRNDAVPDAALPPARSAASA